MSAFFAVILIAIAWILSLTLSGLLDLWHMIAIVPVWVFGILAVGVLAWFMGEP